MLNWIKGLLRKKKANSDTRDDKIGMTCNYRIIFAFDWKHPNSLTY